MKKLGLFLVLSIWMFGALQAQRSEIDFMKTSLNKVIKKAKAEDKYIFIDAYTTWCGPCKMMDQQVFVDEEVAAFYNEKFINAKFNMERGDGVVVAKKYGVNSYPTFLYLDSEGNLVHKVSGFRPKPIFIAIGEEATLNESVPSIQKKIKEQGESPELIGRYVDALLRINLREKADKVIENYLKELDDWEDDEVKKLLIAAPGEVESERFQYILKNDTSFKEIVGESTFIKTLQQSFFRAATRGGKFPGIADMEALYVKYGGPLKDQLSQYYKVAYAEIEGTGYLQAVWNYYTQYPCDDCLELNNIAWAIFEESEDRSKLNQAIEWAEKSVAIERNYYNLDTLAWLLYKTGQKEKAKETAREAIKIAKEQGEDYSMTAKILTL